MSEILNQWVTGQPPFLRIQKIRRREYFHRMPSFGNFA